MTWQSGNCRFLFRIPVRETLFAMAFILLSFAAAPVVKGQSCNNIPEGSGESISAHATIDGPGTLVSDQGYVPAGTRLRLDSIATAGGQCVGMVWNCQVSPCQCQQTGITYLRTINHTNVTVDITSSGVWNGNYTVGTVQFLNAFAQTLDSEAGVQAGQTISR